MCSNRLIDKLSSVEQASQTRRVAAGGGNGIRYDNLTHSTNIVNDHINKNSNHHNYINGDDINNSNNNYSSRVAANREEALSEDAETLPLHIILKTDFRKLNAQTPFFRCPEWADLPLVAFHLHCTRDGVALPSFNLHRYAFYLFGKNAAVCDYILQHLSISNVHAALVFHREQECFVVVDLHSTNGVRVNRTRIPSQKPVPITVGSIIQFGYSTRLYELRSGSAPSSSSEKATSCFARDNNDIDEHDDQERSHENKLPIAKRDRENSESDKLWQYHQPHRNEREEIESLELVHKEKQEAPSHSISVPENFSTPMKTINNRKDNTNDNKINIIDYKHTEISTQEIRHECLAEMKPSSLITLSSSSESELVEQTSNKVVKQNDRKEDKMEVQQQISNHGKESMHIDLTSQEHVPICSAHLYQLVIKHKDVDNPVSRGAHNKGEVITRSKEDARALAMHILHSHDKSVQVTEGIQNKHAFVPWSVDDFVSAVLTYCEVSSAKKKGNLGVVTKGTFTEEFDKVAFALRRNEVSGPVETQIGIHLIYRSDEATVSVLFNK